MEVLNMLLEVKLTLSMSQKGSTTTCMPCRVDAGRGREGNTTRSDLSLAEVWVGGGGRGVVTHEFKRDGMPEVRARAFRHPNTVRTTGSTNELHAWLASKTLKSGAHHTRPGM